MATICLPASNGTLSNYGLSVLRIPPSPELTEKHLTKSIDERINELWVYSQYERFLPRLLQYKHEERYHHLLDYLDSLRDEVRSTEKPEFTESVINAGQEVWEKLKSYFLLKGMHLDVPDACPGNNDDFMYVWSRAEHYLECEIFGTQKVEFFYRNRKSGELWGEDTRLAQQFSAEILSKVEIFAQ